MPITKRKIARKVNKIAKKKPEKKELLVQKLKQALKTYQRAIVFQYANLTTNPLKEIQEAWASDSKFFIGKNKVIQVALGKDEQSSTKKGSYLLSPYLKGQRAILFTNKSLQQVKEFLADLNVPEFAKAGHISQQNVVLYRGLDSLKQFAFSLEPYLRKLGLNTQLINQQIVLNQDYQVAEEGKPINVEQSKILKLLDIKLGKLEIIPLCCLEIKSGSFVKIK